MAQSNDSILILARWELNESNEYLATKSKEICFYDTCSFRLQDTTQVKISITDSNAYEYILSHETIKDMEGYFSFYESMIRNSRVDILTDDYGIYEKITNLFDIHCEFINRYNQVNSESIPKKHRKKFVKSIKAQYESGMLEEKLLENIGFILEPYGMNLPCSDTVTYSDTSRVILGVSWIGNGDYFLSNEAETITLTNYSIYKPDLTDYLTQYFLLNLCVKVGYDNMTIEGLSQFDFAVIFDKYWKIEKKSGWIINTDIKVSFNLSDGDKTYNKTTTISYDLIDK